MSRTIKAIERHMTLPARLGPLSKAASIESRTTKLIAEWQERGPETLSGHTFRKLHLSFAPMPSVIPASSAG